MAVEGEALLERLHAAGAPIESVCKGNGACGTCIVEVRSGAEHLSPSGEEERAMVARRGGNGACRLSCQTRLRSAPNGEVRIVQPMLRIARAERERSARGFERLDWDHSTSHPLLPEAVQAMAPLLAGRYGDPAEGHFFGKRARESVEASRARLAAACGVDPARVALLGGYGDLARLAAERFGCADLAGPAPTLFPPMEPFSRGRVLRPWRFDREGRLDLESAGGGAFAFLGMGTFPTGTRLPVADLAERLRAAGAPFGIDLSWTFPFERTAWQESGAAFASVAPGLFGGPRGIVVALLGDALGSASKEEEPIDPALAAGAAVAVERACAARDAEGRRIAALRDAAEAFFLESYPGAERIGDAASRLPQAACLRFIAWNASGMSAFLDAAGVSLSGGSPESRTARALRALGEPPLHADGAASIWLGCENREAELPLAKDRAAKAIQAFRAVTPSARNALMLRPAAEGKDGGMRDNRLVKEASNAPAVAFDPSKAQFFPPA